jgi:hypothetical protein
VNAPVIADTITLYEPIAGDGIYTLSTGFNESLDVPPLPYRICPSGPMTLRSISFFSCFDVPTTPGLSVHAIVARNGIFEFRTDNTHIISCFSRIFISSTNNWKPVTPAADNGSTFFRFI